MATVVQDDIRTTKLRDDALKKCRIRLISYTHLDLVIFEFPAFGPHIDGYNPGERSEITLPHLRRSATAGTDLEHGNRQADKPSEMASCVSVGAGYLENEHE